MCGNEKVVLIVFDVCVKIQFVRKKWVPAYKLIFGCGMKVGFFIGCSRLQVGLETGCRAEMTNCKEKGGEK